MKGAIAVLIFAGLLGSLQVWGYNAGQQPQQTASNNNYRPSTSGGSHHGRPAFGHANDAGLREVFRWSQFDFAYPTAQARQQAIQTGAFNPSAVVPIGIEAAGSQVFICMPRFRNGVPASLATVPFPSENSSPILTPYPPDWAVHRQGNCEGITSVYRVKVDECNRLWVLDTGVVNPFVQFQQICPPQVHVYDLSTNRRIFRYRLPNNVLRSNSLPVTIEIEYPTRQCGATNDVKGAVMYLADVTAFSLIVVDLRANKAWRVQDKTMYPTPEGGTFTINGESFELMDGVLGLALSSASNQAERTLFFHAMSGFRERWVPTRVLRNETAATTSPRAFQWTEYERPSQAAGCGMDSNNVLFFGMLTNNAIVCWNTKKPFTSGTIVQLAQDDVTMQFPSSVVVDQGDRVWTVTSRFQSFFLGTLNQRDTNYRIFMSPSSTELVRGTACERGGHAAGPGNLHHQGGQQNHNQLIWP